jgi:acetyl esterase/lipase
VDYRLYPEVRYPEFIRDGALATVYVKNHIGHYGGDPDHIIVAGHSAGAYIALMLAADPHYMKAADGARSWITGAVGIAGPYNFLPFTDDAIIDIFSTAPEKTVMPVNRVVGTPPPVFLAAGDEDDTVDPRNSEQLKAALQKAGGAVVKQRYEGVGHIGIILSIAEGFRHKTSLRTDIAAFIDSLNRQ